MVRALRPVKLLFLIGSLLVTTGVQAEITVRIGVLAKRGEEQTINRWQPTAEYLTRELSGYQFVVTPLDFVEIDEAVTSKRIDFVLANSAIYVELESRYGAGRIATMRNRNGHRGYTVFGGVIFTRADNTAINSLEDLKGVRFAAVKENSFGGYQMAWREMAQVGISPDKDTDLVFSGTHDSVVYSVLRGQADAGTVRTDTLERMQLEGKIDLAQLKILNPQRYPNFGYLCSTRLYPEWPFARLNHTADELSHAVAIALLRMPPDSSAARTGMVSGWTVPENYQPVHDLMRELRIGPYVDLGHITFADLLSNYWHWLLLTFLLLASSVSIAAYVTRINLRLREAECELIAARDHLADKVQERTAELEQSHRRLERISRDWNDAFDAIQDPIFIHDAELRIVQANPAYCLRAGHPLETMQGQPYYHFFPKMEWPMSICQQFPEQHDNESDEIRLDNGEIFVSRSFNILSADNKPRHALHILEDVTAQRRSETEMRRLNRALRTLSLCNTTLVHAEAEHELMDDICQILIEHGGYRFVWVGYDKDHTSGQHIQPASYAGHGGEFLQLLMEKSETNGVYEQAQRALRENTPVVMRDLSREEHLSTQWCKAALKSGYAAAVALPLAARGESIGVICIFSDESNVFNDQEMSLLLEMAGDLSFGIHTLRNRIKREQAEQALLQTEERYEELYENAPNAYISVSVNDGRLIQFNQALCDLLGYSRDALQQMKVFDLYADTENGLEKAKALFAKFQQGKGARDVELQMRHASGHPVWVSVSIDPMLDDQGNVVESRSMVIDISERKCAEEERVHFAEKLQRSLLQAIRAIALTIEKRDPYTAGHQERVAELAVKIGKQLGLDEYELEGLRLGALIHDIGKISIPAEILSRPGRLGPEMFSIIKTHPNNGYEIIQGVEFPWPLADMVLQHHERLDGSGYPQGLSGDDICYSARILMVADVVEAMSSHRPYRAGLGLETALDEIRQGSGTRYDSAVVDACLAVFSDPMDMLPWIEATKVH